MPALKFLIISFWRRSCSVLPSSLPAITDMHETESPLEGGSLKLPGTEYWVLQRLVSESVAQSSRRILVLLLPCYLFCLKMLLSRESLVVHFFTSFSLWFKCHLLMNSFLTILCCLKATLSSALPIPFSTCFFFFFSLPRPITIWCTASIRSHSRDRNHIIQLTGVLSIKES